MTWIRFGRNEPQAPSLTLASNRGEDLDVHRFGRDGTLLLFFTPPGGVDACGTLFETLARAPLQEQEAELLVVTERKADLRAGPQVAVAFDDQGRLRARYAELIALRAEGMPLLFILDRDGSPVYAWLGSCDEGEQALAEVMRKLQSAAFLCPECSVPEPASSAMWDVIY